MNRKMICCKDLQLINIDEQFIFKWLGDPNIVFRVIIFTVYNLNICTVLTNRIHDELFSGLCSATCFRLNRSSSHLLNVQWAQTLKLLQSVLRFVRL
jgi:hypothetical protein